ncbi:MAG: hypothetical protein WAW39_00860 [Prosthecobacter sp.]
MKALLLCIACLNLASCAQWHFWRGDAVEQRAYEQVTARYSR